MVKRKCSGIFPGHFSETNELEKQQVNQQKIE